MEGDAHELDCIRSPSPPRRIPPPFCAPTGRRWWGSSVGGVELNPEAIALRAHGPRGASAPAADPEASRG